MSREILFKGKRKNWRDLPKEQWWVEGNLRQDKDLGTAYISDWNYYVTEGGLEREPFEYEIDPETICQYTGRDNIEGKKIWENDILYNGNTMIVEWNQVCGRWDVHINGLKHIPMGEWKPLVVDWRTSDWKEYSDCYEYEVIGNIFDNPELLEYKSRKAFLDEKYGKEKRAWNEDNDNMA